MRKDLSPRSGRFGRDGGGRSLVDFSKLSPFDRFFNPSSFQHTSTFSDSSSIRSFLLISVSILRGQSM